MRAKFVAPARREFLKEVVYYNEQESGLGIPGSWLSCHKEYQTRLRQKISIFCRVPPGPGRYSRLCYRPPFTPPRILDVTCIETLTCLAVRPKPGAAWKCHIRSVRRAGLDASRPAHGQQAVRHILNRGAHSNQVFAAMLAADDVEQVGNRHQRHEHQHRPPIQSRRVKHHHQQCHANIDPDANQKCRQRDRQTGPHARGDIAGDIAAALGQYSARVTGSHLLLDCDRPGEQASRLSGVLQPVPHSFWTRRHYICGFRG